MRSASANQDGLWSAAAQGDITEVEGANTAAIKEAERYYQRKQAGQIIGFRRRDVYRFGALIYAAIWNTEKMREIDVNAIEGEAKIVIARIGAGHSIEKYAIGDDAIKSLFHRRCATIGERAHIGLVFVYAWGQNYKKHIGNFAEIKSSPAKAQSEPFNYASGMRNGSNCNIGAA